MATHSPYIVYALNNAILANIVRNKIPKEEIHRICAAYAMFNVKDVAVWQIKDSMFESIQNGISNTIQDSKGLIRQNYFDNEMKEVMKDFNNMLSYL